MTQTERIREMEQRLERASAAVMRLSAALDDYANATGGYLCIRGVLRQRRVEAG